MENNIEFLENSKNKTTLWSSNSPPGYISKENENTNLNIYLHPNVHSNLIYSRQVTEATCVHQHMNGRKKFKNEILFRLTGKDSDAGKDWGQEEKGATEDEMVGWYSWLSGCKFEQTQADREAQGSFHCRGQGFNSCWGNKIVHASGR